MFGWSNSRRARLPPAAAGPAEAAETTSAHAQAVAPRTQARTSRAREAGVLHALAIAAQLVRADSGNALRDSARTAKVNVPFFQHSVLVGMVFVVALLLVYFWYVRPQPLRDLVIAIPTARPTMLAFVIVAVLVGGALGTKHLSKADQGNGESRRGEKVLASQFKQPAGEQVIVQSPTATIDSATCATGVKEICEEFQGTTPGNEPKSTSTGASATCKFSPLKSC